MVLEKVPTFQEVKDWAASKTTVDNHINDTNNPHNVSADAPVDDVNGQTGSVNLNYNDVGAKSDSYSAPVDSVNGQTGDVSVDSGPGTLVSSGTISASLSAMPGSERANGDMGVFNTHGYFDAIYSVNGSYDYLMSISPAGSNADVHNYKIWRV